MRYVYHLNIGSNIGRRGQCLRRAVIMLSAGNGGVAVSQVVESDPWGYTSPNAFLNAGVKMWSSLEPLEMLDRIHDIERQMGSASHRNDEGGYADRIVDIDIIAVEVSKMQVCERENCVSALTDYCSLCDDGNIIVNLPELKVPHPLMHQREFVLRPMAQIAPQWRHPMLHLTAFQLLNNITSVNS